jgi:hypothetical protein
VVSRERGQAHTLEAVVAGLLLLSSIIFALQMTAVTPLSASTSSQHIENQQRSVAQGALATAASQGALKESVLYWNDTGGQFHGTSDIGYYTNEPPNTTFGAILQQTFDDRSISYNVYIQYQKQSGGQASKPMIYRGRPSDNAVSASRSVTLMDDDPLIRADGTANHSVDVSSASTYPAQNVGTSVYNVVRVEVVAWRI